MDKQHRARLRRALIPLLGWLMLAVGAGNASALAVMERRGASAMVFTEEAQEFPFECLALDGEECASIVGGDVRMVLNPSRTKLTVNVIDNEYEARLGRIPPKEVYEIDVHNRIVETTSAPFMPTGESRRQLGTMEGVMASAGFFPEGNWLVTGVKARGDKYGPYMIGTGAVGEVDVYCQGLAEGEKIYLGRYKDNGYAIPSNTVPFEYSKSYGCLVARQEDVARLADTLRRDKQENEKAVQTIRIRSRYREND